MEIELFRIKQINHFFHKVCRSRLYSMDFLTNYIKNKLVVEDSRDKRLIPMTNWTTSYKKETLHFYKQREEDEDIITEFGLMRAGLVIDGTKFIVVDIDHNMTFDDFKTKFKDKFEFVMYTSFNHQYFDKDKNKQNDDRFRVIIPLDRFYTLDEYESCIPYLLKTFKGCDTSTFEIKRYFADPCVRQSEKTKYRCCKSSGSRFRLNPIIKKPQSKWDKFIELSKKNYNTPTNNGLESYIEKIKSSDTDPFIRDAGYNVYNRLRDRTYFLKKNFNNLRLPEVIDTITKMYGNLDKEMIRVITKLWGKDV